MFRDREDAARQLAVRLAVLELTDPLVLGIPRGGAVTGATIARAIGAEFDVVLARKLRAPWQAELAIGGIAEDGEVYLDRARAAHSGADEPYVNAERERQLAEIRRRSQLFRAVRPPASEAGRSVILTDDGMATGSTMEAALHVARGRGAREVIIAVPVAPQEALRHFRERGERLICLLEPEVFWAIGQFYEDFTQVSDEEVVALLRPWAPQEAASAPCPAATKSG
jgi:hypothetical protein